MIERRRFTSRMQNSLWAIAVAVSVAVIGWFGKRLTEEVGFEYSIRGRIPGVEKRLDNLEQGQQTQYQSVLQMLQSIQTMEKDQMEILREQKRVRDDKRDKERK